MRLYVPLTQVEFDKLRDLAQGERRRPQDQAAVILTQALVSEPARSTGDSDTAIEPTPGHESAEIARETT